MAAASIAPAGLEDGEERPNVAAVNAAVLVNVCTQLARLEVDKESGQVAAVDAAVVVIVGRLARRRVPSFETPRACARDRGIALVRNGVAIQIFRRFIGDVVCIGDSVGLTIAADCEQVDEVRDRRKRSSPSQ